MLAKALDSIYNISIEYSAVYVEGKTRNPQIVKKGSSGRRGYARSVFIRKDRYPVAEHPPAEAG